MKAYYDTSSHNSSINSTNSSIFRQVDRARETTAFESDLEHSLCSRVK